MNTETSRFYSVRDLPNVFRRTLHAHRNVRAEKENEGIGQKEKLWKENCEGMNQEELALRIISNQYKIERILEYFKN